MYENQKVDKVLDGLKHRHFIGLRSNILTNEKLRSDFNATAEHVKDMVNQTATLKNPPGRQVAAMGRGGGRGRGTDRGGREGRGGRVEEVGAEEEEEEATTNMKTKMNIKMKTKTTHTRVDLAVLV